MTTKRTTGPRPGTFWHVEHDPHTGEIVTTLRGADGTFAELQSEPDLRLEPMSDVTDSFTGMTSETRTRVLLDRVNEQDVFRSTLSCMWDDGDTRFNAGANMLSPAEESWVHTVIAQATLNPRFQEFAEYSDLTESSDDLDDVNDLSYALMQDAIAVVDSLSQDGNDIRPRFGISVYLDEPSGMDHGSVQKINLFRVGENETVISAERYVDLADIVPDGADAATWMEKNRDDAIDALSVSLNVNESLIHDSWDEDSRIWVNSQIRHFGPINAELAYARAINETHLHSLSDLTWGAPAE